MLKASVCLPFCNYAHDTTNLRNCLDSLAAQTQKAHQIILSDDSLPEDRAEVKEICERYGVEYLEFPFVMYAPAFSRKFNASFARVTGDAIALLCSNWRLGPDWIEKMAQWLEELGPRNVIACDNARHAMQDAKGNTIDWFAGHPDRFEVHNYHLIDEGFLTMIHTCDWVPWDEDFDPPPGDMSETKGAWHAVIVWGSQLMGKGVRIWIRRDLQAEHQVDLHRRGRETWYAQTMASDRLMRAKGIH